VNRAWQICHCDPLDTNGSPPNDWAAFRNHYRPATAALADGDDMRARFLANLCGDATRAADPDR